MPSCNPCANRSSYFSDLRFLNSSIRCEVWSESVKTSVKLPNRRAAASLALISVLSVVENQRKQKAQRPGEADFWQDMSGELQTIPARHGVATFVPRGRTIKVINTYGKQVVSTWAFSLHAPPKEGENDEEEKLLGDEGDIEERAEELKKHVGDEGKEQVEKHVEKPKQEVEKAKEASKDTKEANNETEDPPEKTPDTPENEKSTETTENGKSIENTEESKVTEALENGKSTENITEKKQPEKRTWSSYLPSIPYRSKDASSNTKPDMEVPKDEKARNEATSKAWSSYLPTGKGFSNYVPNVQIPDSKNVISAFKASHDRDPNKSYAEQLYDFSKTPVGAGTLAAASGSGTASSLYAAYSAYTKMNPFAPSQPPMEYLSLPHTRASTHRLVPEVNDTLLTNLRNPIMKIIEDTTPGAHDTLTAACDASQYVALGTHKPEEHGSCAENLVLALKELNEKAGLKGTKAVGADITVNIAPTPLHLFMNAPINLASSQASGAGAKGATLSIEEPQGKKRSYIRFRAERDIVIVMSACPMDIGKQNGGKCMAANFIVEEASDEDLSASSSSAKKQASSPKQDVAKEGDAEEGKQGEQMAMPKPRGGPAKIAGVKKSAQEAGKRRDSAAESTPAPDNSKNEKKQLAGEAKNDQPVKPKKKPKKLERRGAGTAVPKSEASGIR
ncbi:hypothetical protein CC78DRAFT_527859 [Lojkania enalia]|uniref:DUF1989 domain-containing protein n=1 Tax=Lojkania enalia TaxID=147567 RepID=A0A9P4NCR7_9PLEO|nr:hypothetical protein CC78DRAFT_527859 [Didymosphaeria enalia]